MTTILERPADSAGELYYPTPTTPEEAFQAIGRLRKEARDEIDRLIQFIDDTDDYVSRELEDQVDDGPVDDTELEPSFCGVTAAGARAPSTVNGPDSHGDELEGDGEDGLDANDEPSLGSVAGHDGYRTKNAGQCGWAQGVADDRESDPGCDDLEPVCEDEGAEHDGAEPDQDGEPSLGWTVDGAFGLCGDREVQNYLSGPDIAAARARAATSDDRWSTNRDGMHVDAEQGWGDRRRLRNLSDLQKEIVGPRVDRDKVSIT